MKILFNQDALVSAGAERSHLEILFRFSKDVDLVFVYLYPKHDLKTEYERAGIRLFFLDIPESYHFHLAIYRLVRLIKEEKPDLLVSSLWRADIITRIASKLTGVPLVGTLVNDSYAPIAWTDKKGLKYKIVYWLDRWTSSIPVHWIANAQALADSHVKTLGIKREKISVVYRGRAVPLIVPDMPTSWQSSNNQIANQIASAANITKDQSSKLEIRLPPQQEGAMTNSFRNFISYGRLLERKGFQDAIQAFSQILQTYPDCTLTIFGEGPYRTQLECLIQDLGLKESVYLPGKISNPIEALTHGYCPLPTAHCLLPTNPDTYRDCPLLTADCFVFPSWYEGFSGALVEAMMAGMPIIASDIPMNLEAITDQKSALVFPVQNIESFKDCMFWAIKNPFQMKAMGNEARLSAIQRFDIQKIAFQYEDTLIRIINQFKQS